MESLAAAQMKKLKETRETYDFQNVWISDGFVFCFHILVFQYFIKQESTIIVRTPLRPFYKGGD